jgi:hypothetical protein|tara:strand:+ start:32 stop:139 length:108 start_codon:yes stop_codon:yes gene_type:complete
MDGERKSLKKLNKFKQKISDEEFEQKKKVLQDKKK